MKYKQILIKEDNQILEGVNQTHLAKKLGCDRSYLSLVKNNKIICTFEFYQRVKEAILNEKNN
jgi:hypothetical protein